MHPEILAFAAAIGAVEPSEDDQAYRAFRRRFRRHNYFFHPSGLFLVIKLSRHKNLFWGLGKEIVDYLNNAVPYSVILLQSASQGWTFRKDEVNYNIERGEWKLESTGREYKIHAPPQSKMFFGPKGCQQKLGVP